MRRTLLVGTVSASPVAQLCTLVFARRASFMSKMIMVEDTPIKYQIWDTAGQEKYHSLAPMYYRGAAAAIVVYDITRKVRRVGLLREWRSEVADSQA